MASGRQVRALSFAVGWACAGGYRPQWQELSDFEQSLEEEEGSICLPLENVGPSSTVNVEIGTPRQGPFRLIADTGSNSLIVQSCFCGATGGCITTADTRCYRGTNASSTYSLFTQDGWMAPVAGQPENPEVEEIAFGSGLITGIIARDEVCVGGLCVMMEDAFLSMVDARLSIEGPTIEGILGLGLPESYTGGVLTGSDGAAVERLPAGMPRTSSFLEQANIKRFSLCLNEGAGGVLRLRTPPQAHGLGSFGEVHWGLGIDGIHVVGAAGKTTPLAIDICSRQNMSAEQETPCGAIPDSGTTMITGPETHIAAIKATLCDAWERCSSLVSQAASPAPLAEASGAAEISVKAQAFVKLVEDCASWMHEGGGTAEMPALEFHLTGRGGGLQTVSLPPHNYIFEAQEEGRRVCFPALDAFDDLAYATPKNGPVFILGTPLFYEYRVDYDLGAVPPSVAFAALEQSPCGSCGPQGHFIQMGSGERQQQRRPRRVDGPPLRRPAIDLRRGF